MSVATVWAVARNAALARCIYKVCCGGQPTLPEAFHRVGCSPYPLKWQEGMGGKGHWQPAKKSLCLREGAV